MHRARMLAWDLPKVGWGVEVLTAGEEFQRPESVDAESSSLFNPEIRVHQVAPKNQWLFRLLKMRSIGWRALTPFYRKGCELLTSGRFDLVYLSTTQFNLFCLGRLWQRRFHVPYVLDFHDPWVRDYRVSYTTTKHKFKLLISRFLAKPLEKFAVKGAAGLVSVSPIYIDQLRRRYPNACCLTHNRAVVIPFAATNQDLIASSPMRVAADSTRTIVYVGAGGSIMAKSFKRVMELLLLVRDKRLRESIRICLYGTDSDWKEGLPKYLQEIAKSFGLEKTVRERPTRIPYSESLRRISASDSLLILGVDDPAYMPSKLFTYSLAGKPVLVCLHKDSQAKQYFERTPGIGTLIQFGDTSLEARQRDLALLESFLSDTDNGTRYDRRKVLEPYLAAAAATRHAELFDRCFSAKH
jgi:glycosyltransferase involved in cell wall biosynthesis